MERVKRDYRKFYRIFLILFLLSFTVNLFMLTLYLRERKGVPSPPPTESKEIQEVKAPQETKAPQEMVPLPFVQIKNKDSFLLCDKQNKTLYLYRSEEGAFKLIKSYPCI
ncbi:MAG: hypothetical protein MUP27_00635, partial [Desulfobacterales bacterium]|nr:hypothetical protein [Desulfobacterales bacterium]